MWHDFRMLLAKILINTGVILETNPLQEKQSNIEDRMAAHTTGFYQLLLALSAQ